MSSIVIIKIDEKSHRYLLEILSEKYYTTKNLEELKNLNNLYKLLKFKSESWLSNINQQENQQNN